MDIGAKLRLLKELQSEDISTKWLEKLCQAFDPDLIGDDYTRRGRSVLETSVRELARERENLREEIRHRQQAIAEMEESLHTQEATPQGHVHVDEVLRQLPARIQVISKHIEGGGATSEMRAGVLEKLVHLSLQNEPMYAPSDNPLVIWLIQRNIVRYEPLEHRKVLKLWLW